MRFCRGGGFVEDKFAGAAFCERASILPLSRKLEGSSGSYHDPAVCIYPGRREEADLARVSQIGHLNPAIATHSSKRRLNGAPSTSRHQAYEVQTALFPAKTQTASETFDVILAGKLFDAAGEFEFEEGGEDLGGA